MKYPQTCPVFANRLHGKNYPDLIVGVDILAHGDYEIEGIRPDNGDAVFYKRRWLKPLTVAATEMLSAAARRGGK